MGYRDVRHYVGGLAEWTERGGTLETQDPSAAAAPVARAGGDSGSAARGGTAASVGMRLAHGFLDTLAERSIGDLLKLWLGMILGFGALYWLADGWRGYGLLSGGEPVDLSVGGLSQAIYFSFVTALSIGYGDVVPVGPARVLAIAEGAAGLLIFGCVISKLVSRRQEEMVGEIHRIAFEDRLGRVRTNLHLVLSELQSIATTREIAGGRPDRLRARIESAATVFVGELRTIHDLLYRPQQIPDEEALESILAGLSAGLQELSDLVASEPVPLRSASLNANLRSLSRLAEEICGECVPRTYAPSLKGTMDTIQERARAIARA